jgi:hypothetical protein
LKGGDQFLKKVGLVPEDLQIHDWSAAGDSMADSVTAYLTNLQKNVTILPDGWLCTFMGSNPESKAEIPRVVRYDHLQKREVPGGPRGGLTPEQYIQMCDQARQFKITEEKTHRDKVEAINRLLTQMYTEKKIPEIDRKFLDANTHTLTMPGRPEPNPTWAYLPTFRNFDVLTDTTVAKPANYDRLSPLEQRHWDAERVTIAYRPISLTLFYLVKPYKMQRPEWRVSFADREKAEANKIAQEEKARGIAVVETKTEDEPPEDIRPAEPGSPADIARVHVERTKEQGISKMGKRISEKREKDLIRWINSLMTENAKSDVAPFQTTFPFAYELDKRDFKPFSPWLIRFSEDMARHVIRIWDAEAETDLFYYNMWKTAKSALDTTIGPDLLRKAVASSTEEYKQFQDPVIERLIAAAKAKQPDLAIGIEAFLQSKQKEAIGEPDKTVEQQLMLKRESLSKKLAILRKALGEISDSSATQFQQAAEAVADSLLDEKQDLPLQYVALETKNDDLFRRQRQAQIDALKASAAAAEMKVAASKTEEKKRKPPGGGGKESQMDVGEEQAEAQRQRERENLALAAMEQEETERLARERRQPQQQQQTPAVPTVVSGAGAGSAETTPAPVSFFAQFKKTPVVSTPAEIPQSRPSVVPAAITPPLSVSVPSVQTPTAMPVKRSSPDVLSERAAQTGKQLKEKLKKEREERARKNKETRAAAEEAKKKTLVPIEAKSEKLVQISGGGLTSGAVDIARNTQSVPHPVSVGRRRRSKSLSPVKPAPTPSLGAGSAVGLGSGSAAASQAPTPAIPTSPVAIDEDLDFAPALAEQLGSRGPPPVSEVSAAEEDTETIPEEKEERIPEPEDTEPAAQPTFTQRIKGVLPMDSSS